MASLRNAAVKRTGQKGAVEVGGAILGHVMSNSLSRWARCAVRCPPCLLSSMSFLRASATCWRVGAGVFVKSLGWC